MKIVMGIDVGGSTTKICGFRESGELISPLTVRADDPVSSIYGAFGKFTAKSAIALSDIKRVMITGVGAGFVQEDLYGIPTEHVREFDCIGLGGRYLAGLDDCVVVSMGTGTALVYVKEDTAEYLGGTGVGGGTLHGLAETMLGIRDVTVLNDLSEKGDLGKVDLRICDISKTDLGPILNKNATAANFGKISQLVTKEDLALGIENLVFETIGMISVFAARSKNTKNVILTGNMMKSPHCHRVFDVLGQMFDLNFVFPAEGQYSTVIGAALLHDHPMRNV